MIAHGYVLVKEPHHPIAHKSGNVLEHRKVWFEAHGEIPDGFVIHHKNGDRSDNRLENLEMMSRSAHMKEHYANGLGVRNGKKAFVELECGVCGTKFVRQKQRQTGNSKRKGTTLFIPTCNRICWGKLMEAYRNKDLSGLHISRALKWNK